MSATPTCNPHRKNEEVSYDSICRICFAAVARSKAEAELADYEKAHVCTPSYLDHHGHFTRSA
jgi:hypothetical protein